MFLLTRRGKCDMGACINVSTTYLSIKTTNQRMGISFKNIHGMTAQKQQMETGAIRIGEVIRYMWYNLCDICMKCNVFSLKRRRFRADLISPWSIFTWANHICPLAPHRPGLRSYAFSTLQGPSYLWRTSGAFSVPVMKYWNSLPASIIMHPRCLPLGSSWAIDG